jgi:hypothetical protein
VATVVDTNSDATIILNDYSALAGATVLTAAFSFVPSNPLSGNNLFSQWGVVSGFQAFLFQRADTDEIAFYVQGPGGYRGRKTNGTNPLVVDTLIRVMGVWVADPTNLMEIWINGVSQSLVSAGFDSNTTSLVDSPTAVQAGGVPTISPNDGMFGQYSEAAIWVENVPTWVKEGYGKGMSPAFYRNANSVCYCKGPNINNMVDEWSGFVGAISNATDANNHPSMYYRR